MNPAARRAFLSSFKAFIQLERLLTETAARQPLADDNAARFAFRCAYTPLLIKVRDEAKLLADLAPEVGLDPAPFHHAADYPAAARVVDMRVAVEQLRSARAKKIIPKKLSKAEVEDRVRASLKSLSFRDGPSGVRIKNVAVDIGLSVGRIQRTSAWRAFNEHRKESHPTTSPKTVSLTPAREAAISMLLDEQKKDARQERSRSRSRRVHERQT